jgi:hypothetical protein
MKLKKYILVFLVMGSALSFSSSRRLKRLGKRISNIVKKDKDKETTDRQGTDDIFQKIEKKGKDKKDKKDKNVNRAGIDEAIKKKKVEDNSPEVNLKETQEGLRNRNNQ